MPYSFSKFEATNSRYETRITVTKSNHIGFPTMFYRDNRVADYKYAVLYYDPQEMAIAVRFTNDEAETGRFSIMRSNRDYGGGVVATSFFKANRIDTQRYAGRYDYEKLAAAEVGVEGNADLFVIKLKEKDR